MNSNHIENSFERSRHTTPHYATLRHTTPHHTTPHHTTPHHTTPHHTTTRYAKPRYTTPHHTGLGDVSNDEVASLWFYGSNVDLLQHAHDLILLRHDLPGRLVEITALFSLLALFPLETYRHRLLWWWWW